MRKMDEDILDGLTDNDIKRIIGETKLDVLLHPFKQNSKVYAKYMQRLGRLDTKSVMVRTNLPVIVYELYKKGDPVMRKILQASAERLKDIIVQMLSDYPNEELTLDSLVNMPSAHCIEVLTNIESRDSDNRIDIDLLFLQFRLNNVNIEKTKETEICSLWANYREKQEEERKRKQETEDIIKALEDSHKFDMRTLRKEYDIKVAQYESRIKELESEIKKQVDSIAMLQDKVDKREKDSKFRIEELENSLISTSKQLTEKQKMCKDTEKELADFKREVETQKLDFCTAWLKELEDENEELVKHKNSLSIEVLNLQNQIEDLLDNKQVAEADVIELREELSKAKDEFLNIQTQRENTVTTEEDSTSNGGGFVSYSLVGPRLYIEPGTNAIQKDKCEKYSSYVQAVETNLDIAGCRMTAGRIEDFFNATIDTGLMPLLYGFGARRAAMAMIAARYGEIPTIISIPAGYSDVDTLSREIDEAETDVIIIEDLFGRMNEEIILPVFRRDIDKQLVLCAESFECLKYTETYFMNYIQLIRVDITSHRRMHSLMFTDATELFTNFNYSGRTEIHKNIRKLFKGIEVSDIYSQSRGDLFAYMDENMQHDMGAVYQEWFEHEVLKIVKPEQQLILKERLFEDSLGISKELIESLGE